MHSATQSQGHMLWNLLYLRRSIHRESREDIKMCTDQNTNKIQSDDVLFHWTNVKRSY